mmetsp:Transcript_22758/g.49874  ORF Transcript_22758/g.49874 Transcript_22758/m.49874 type:complete len:227 (+) Transcript_22758:450-1130(+)|eukprot:CAMPEP_0118951542 /NCGR_PEP_ID=MMETSP1169-20130426/53319_1 /TAXON_ID=36882 /ORGANISM="Pyramimonas obovata, Strain CCMP722" /LENGTH=226 /DNA_ID=CAMNT_0006898617 /DNA_START=380 /DNA_END=1060 /DNA_ORIENTATION=-
MVTTSVLCKRKSGEVAFSPTLIDNSPSNGTGKKARGGQEQGQQYDANPVDCGLLAHSQNPDPLHSERLKFLHQCGCQTLPKEHLVGPSGDLTPVWLCFSTLNVLHRQYGHIEDIPLTRYHTFTRGKKEEIYQRFMAAYGSTSHPATLSLVDFVFQVSLLGLPEARLECVFFAAPQWLHEWCRIYGLDPSRVPMLRAQGFVDCTQLGGIGLHAGASFLLPMLAPGSV